MLLPPDLILDHNQDLPEQGEGSNLLDDVKNASMLISNSSSSEIASYLSLVRMVEGEANGSSSTISSL